MGFSIATTGEGWYFSHGGANWDFRSNLIMHRVKGYGLAVLTNSDNGGPLMNEIQRRVRRAYAWDSEQASVPRGYDASVTTPPVTVAAEVLAQYGGEYVGADRTLSVRLEGGILQVRGDGGSTRLRFVRDAPGRVTTLMVRLSGRERPLQRR